MLSRAFLTDPAAPETRRPATRRYSPWLVPAGLILLSLFPIVGGAARLTELTGGAAITPENERFFHSPVAIVLHIVSVTVYTLVGAFQFVPSLRRRTWHRIVGRVLVPMGLLAALSGLWLATLYFTASGGVILLLVRLIIGLSMVVSIALGLLFVWRVVDVPRHGAWMTRAYAIGAAAGTEALLIIGPEVLSKSPDGTGQIVFTASAWLANLIVAEYVIYRRRRAKAA